VRQEERTMLSTVIGRLRVIGWLEGMSYLLLLFVAMPLKYLAGHPEMVEVVGMAHGVLFMGFCAAAVHAAVACKWPLLRLAAAFVSAVLPFGPFIFDAWCLRSEPATPG
jgi:integral membrane protein